MTVKGCMLIGSNEVWGQQQSFNAVNPSTSNEIEPLLGGQPVRMSIGLANWREKHSTATATLTWNNALNFLKK